MEKEMATHSSILAWKIPWTEEPGRLQSMGLQRVGHDWATSLSLSLLHKSSDHWPWIEFFSWGQESWRLLWLNNHLSCSGYWPPILYEHTQPSTISQSVLLSHPCVKVNHSFHSSNFSSLQTLHGHHLGLKITSSHPLHSSMSWLPLTCAHTVLYASFSSILRKPRHTHLLPCLVTGLIPWNMTPCLYLHCTLQYLPHIQCNDDEWSSQTYCGCLIFEILSRKLQKAIIC